jgi:hypothetical protein
LRNCKSKKEKGKRKKSKVKGPASEEAGYTESQKSLRKFMILMGLSGRARSGKTACCGAIAEHHRNHAAGGVGIYDFGAEVLAECKEKGLLPATAVRSELRPLQLSVLQDWGYRRRQEDARYWIRRLEQRIARENPALALVPNIRYQNEAAWVHGAGGHLVRVVRLNANGTPYISSDRDPNHPSETELEFWPADYYLTARGGDEALLCRQAVALYAWLLERKAATEAQRHRGNKE